jgi:hypothetical protein
MPLAVGDYDSVPHVWFRGKSLKKYINDLKYGEISKYPSNGLLKERYKGG